MPTLGDSLEGMNSVSHLLGAEHRCPTIQRCLGGIENVWGTLQDYRIERECIKDMGQVVSVWQN
jgi:hypothetical protein